MDIWCLMPISTIFKLYHGGQFIRGRNQSTRRKLSQVTYTLYHIMLCTSPWAGFKLTTSVAICSNCIGSCKYNYHRITAKTTQTPDISEVLNITNFRIVHRRLLHKLRYYGIRNNTFLWIQDFLSHRTQEVQLEGHKSTTADVLSGVILNRVD